MDAADPNFATEAVHAGEDPDPVHGGLAPSIVASVNHAVTAGSAFSALLQEPDAPHLYSRWSNPTVRQLEEKVAALEHGERAVAFASGMAAISALLLHRLSAGDHLVISDVCYAGVAELTHDTLPRLGISVSHVDTSSVEEVAAAIRPETRLVYVETPANPILRLADIPAPARAAHDAGVELAVDSTLATPAVTRPLDLGADLVVHSLTKFMNGHGDALGGAVIGRAAPIGALRQDAGIHLGGTLSPFNAWLILRGLTTLPARMALHSANALAVARFLEAHPRVTRAVYPFLDSHPQRELADRQMRGGSGMVSFQADDPLGLAVAFGDKLEIVRYAVSLGHQRSLLFYLPTVELNDASFRLDADHLARYRSFGGDGVFRLSVGLEDPDDICRDLARVLDEPTGASRNDSTAPQKLTKSVGIVRMAPDRPPSRPDPSQEDRPMTTTLRDVSLVVTPLSGTIGAEIRGVDLTQPLDPATVAAIRRVLLDRRVVFFPAQHPRRRAAPALRVGLR